MNNEIHKQLTLAANAFAMVRTPIGLIKAEIQKGAFIRVSDDEKEVLSADYGIVGKLRDCQISNKLTGWIAVDTLKQGVPYVRKAVAK